MASEQGAQRVVSLHQYDGLWAGRFCAMACPCEVLIEGDNESLAESLTTVCAEEAWRIEDKFSRYLAGNIVERINRSGGSTVEVDDETAGLIDFSLTLYELSDGLFDISSGVLREVWTFDGSDRIPSQGQIDSVLPRVGLDKMTWRDNRLTLAPHMQIDLGGIGKEYSVDRAAALAAAHPYASCLVNFGGDLCVSRERRDGQAWRVGIESSGETIELTRGALATSGDDRRFVEKDSVRYSHVLDPTTGWPVVDAPRSLTVVADTCTQAGMLATLALLKGSGAERFLESQGIQFWSRRD